MFELCSSMIGAPWLCWAIQITAITLIGLFLWRIVRRRSGPGGGLTLQPVPVSSLVREPER